MKVNENYSFLIDVASTCNLKCPSCPQANPKNPVRRNELMEPELLDSILRKATSECQISFVYLYNWAEPFLNPKLPDLIDIVNSHNIPCGVSSNLNIRRNIDRVVASNPANFVISTSGFNQHTYGKMHAAGNVERVKENMIWLSEVRKNTNSRTRVEVNYIRYLGNLDELVLMRKFAASLGFFFRQSIAALFPLERLLKYLSDSQKKERTIDEEKELFEILLFPYEELMQLSGPFKRFPCSYREEQIVLNSRGQVQLCCLVFDPTRFTITDFLSDSIERIRELKRGQDFCKSCIEKGIHTLGLRFGPNLRPVVLKKVADYYSEAGVDFHNLPRTSNGLWFDRSVRLLKESARRSIVLRRLTREAVTRFPVLKRLPGDILSLE
ncbi:radical SAM protein [Desulfomonile tiedjei]|uniref:Radical SAM core domain-containing protein n=1 Tax=Desulfomonile tiedjei (strain ATCC 49306 / DSM 6799 / DCB-1) TaxID=706587 RepID=I4C5V8_DESTA|nr:radical SAM protein [Desulfomonile tiedjei]AFM24949.1 hypothetical protein Desti_2258 [Desulfomonile tiedjei DSM 6799]